jgi:hypothetical protein
MDSATQVHTSNGTKDDDQTTQVKDRKLVDRLVNLWKSHAERGLGTRHQTGRLLNERLGSPDRRQPHARQVLKMVAGELGIAESDLNRMRWYAHLTDATALRQDHPEITSWTRIKEELTNLKAEYGFGARKPSASPSRPAFGGFARSLANLTSKLNGLDIRPAGAERQKLVDALRGLAEAASRRLRIDVEVAVRVKESKPVVKKRLDQVARA